MRLGEPSRDELDQTELRESLAEAVVDFWKDADAGDPGRRVDGTSEYGTQARSSERR